jgi:mannose-6-phosphate isomerase-like protein (cupin superfamily)
MIFDFDKMPEQNIPNFKGGEGSICTKAYSDEKIRTAVNVLASGSSIGYHMHENNSEVIYVLGGEALLKYDGKEDRLRKGLVHYCPMGHSHSIINDSGDDFVFFSVVSEYK